MSGERGLPHPVKRLDSVGAHSSLRLFTKRCLISVSLSPPASCPIRGRYRHSNPLARRVQARPGVDIYTCALDTVSVHECVCTTSLAAMGPGGVSHLLHCSSLCCTLALHALAPSCHRPHPRPPVHQRPQSPRRLRALCSREECSHVLAPGPGTPGLWRTLHLSRQGQSIYLGHHWRAP